MAREPLTLDLELSHARSRRVAAIILRQVYLFRSSAVADCCPSLHVGGRGHDPVGLHDPLPQLGQQAPGFDFVPTLLGAVLLWDFFTRVMQGITVAFFEDVWSRNFLNTFATPLSIAEYLAGLVLTAIGTSTVSLVVMLVVATTVFALPFFSYGLVLAPLIFTLFLFGIALGVASCALVLRFGPAAEWFIWPIPALLSPFVGVCYPLAVLPAWMRWVGHLLPPSYVFDGVAESRGGAGRAGRSGGRRHGAGNRVHPAGMRLLLSRVSARR